MITILQEKFKNKRIFNPNEQKDIECYKKFLQHSRWEPDGCPFILENPHLSVPHMIQDKIVKNLLGV